LSNNRKYVFSEAQDPEKGFLATRGIQMDGL
jgi:hypothetical protein